MKIVRELVKFIFVYGTLQMANRSDAPRQPRRRLTVGAAEAPANYSWAARMSVSGGLPTGLAAYLPQPIDGHRATWVAR